MRIALLAAAIAALCFIAPAQAAPSTTSQIHKQLARYYHADGYIKAIGRVAHRTIYSPNPRLRRKWQRAVHWLVSVRKDAAAKLYALRHPQPVYHALSVDSCLDALIHREGGYNAHAVNPSSGAYGAPQALPGSKMASAGADWRDNLGTQIRWMIGYVNATYGGSCAALAHSYSYGWY